MTASAVRRQQHWPTRVGADVFCPGFTSSAGDYTMQKLSKLRPCFTKGGTTTVGNACQVGISSL